MAEKRFFAKYFNGERIMIGMYATNTYVNDKDPNITHTGRRDGDTHREWLGEYPVETMSDIPTKANHWELLEKI